MNFAHDWMVEGVKLTPPAAVATAPYMGMTPDQWLTLLTIVYVLGLLAHQLPKHLVGAVRLAKAVVRLGASLKRRWADWRRQ